MKLYEIGINYMKKTMKLYKNNEKRYEKTIMKKTMKLYEKN